MLRRCSCVNEQAKREYHRISRGRGRKTQRRVDNPWQAVLLRCILGFANQQAGVLEIGENHRGEAVRVANVFSRAGMIEAWGRGIETILEACRALGSL